MKHLQSFTKKPRVSQLNVKDAEADHWEMGNQVAESRAVMLSDLTGVGIIKRW